MKMKRTGMFLAFLLLFALAACSSNDQKVDGTKSEPKTEDSSGNKAEATKAKPTGKTVEVTVTAKSFDFDLKEIKANVGDNIKIHLVNADGAHGFAIDEYGIDIKGGETAEFMATKKGEFQFYCSLMCGVGHDKMIGKLIVQ